MSLNDCLTDSIRSTRIMLYNSWKYTSCKNSEFWPLANEEMMVKVEKYNSFHYKMFLVHFHKVEQLFFCFLPSISFSLG